MKIKTSIQIRAALLLVVFSLNTVLGFACAIGINMAFNGGHHIDEELSAGAVHTHADGKQHIQHNEVNPHDEAENDHHENEDKNKCCHDKVIKFNEVDKIASHPYILISPVFFTSFLASFYDISISFTSYVDSGIKYYVRSYHPPIPDIRIAIQSFQI